MSRRPLWTGPVRHYILVPDMLGHPKGGCAVCHRQRRGDWSRTRDTSCRRCRMVMHWDCYWEHVASPAERAREAAGDRSGLILCSGCRS